MWFRTLSCRQELYQYALVVFKTLKWWVYSSIFVSTAYVHMTHLSNTASKAHSTYVHTTVGKFLLLTGKLFVALAKESRRFLR